MSVVSALNSHCSNCGVLFCSRGGITLCPVCRRGGTLRECIDRINWEYFKETKRKKRKYSRRTNNVPRWNHITLAKIRAVGYFFKYVGVGYLFDRKTPAFDSSLYRRGTCSILKKHAILLKHDPERLSTDFLKRCIGLDKKECFDSNTGAQS